MISQLLSALLYGAGAFLAAYAAMSVMRTRRARQTEPPKDVLIYLVRDDQLVDANAAGKRVLETISSPVDPLGKLKAYLATHFDEYLQIFDEPLQPGVQELSSLDQKSKLQIETTDTSIRLQLSSSDLGFELDDVHSVRALKSELSTLRANARAAPFLLWRQTAEGKLTWVNQAYLDAVKAFLGDEMQASWPLPNLFPTLKMSVGKPSRIALKDRDDKDAWFDCHVTSVGRDFLCTAFEADEVVRSENRRREFTQTLTKTFAELAIGLAIFDRSRSLVLFNPALLDLTNLPTDFLSSRPSMVNFLDRLRENRVMPEPRDYRTWRNSIAELEAAAQDGTYSETWSLPDGHTYHVTGRPHPDGAVALLFEDISAEMSLTRRFRAELEQSQSVIDALEDGVAMFSAAGQLILTNKAYCDIWSTEDPVFLTGADVSDVTRHWHELAVPTPVWGDFRDFTQRAHDREEWQSVVALKDGRNLACRFLPQKGGGTLAVFRLISVGRLTKDDLQKAV